MSMTRPMSVLDRGASIGTLQLHNTTTIKTKATKSFEKFQLKFPSNSLKEEHGNDHLKFPLKEKQEAGYPKVIQIRQNSAKSLNNSLLREEREDG